MFHCKQSIFNYCKLFWCCLFPFILIFNFFQNHFCDNNLSETHSGHDVENDDLAEDDDNIEAQYSGTVTPTTTLRRAKESFLRQQKDIFKEYEEVRLFF